MKQWTAFGAGSALALLLGTTAVQADVTAEQVWQGWVDYYSANGQDVTSAASAKEGDTLVVKDAVIASKPNERSSVKLTLSEVRLRETGDGKVEVTLPAEMPIAITGKDPEGKTTDSAVKVTQTGLLVVAAGAPEDITYDMKAATVGLSLDSVKSEGKDVPMVVEMMLQGITGQSHLVRTGGFGLESTFAAASADLKISATSETEGSEGKFDMTGSLQGLTGSSQAQIVDGADLSTDLAAALNAGTKMSGEFGYGGGTYSANFSGAEGAGKIDYKDTAGKIHFAMSKDGMTYGGEAGAAQMTATLPNLPPDLAASFGSSQFEFASPVSKGDAPQPFKVVTKLVDLTLADAIWDMFDPARNLPRDPATLIIDAKGNATLKLDIFDPALAEGDKVPGQIDDLTLNELKLSLAGAALTGTGQATIDNSTGTPKPVGAVDLKLVGGNGLIDKLVAMGLIPEDQAMGVRMMLGAFAVPAGDDVLTSKIEFKEDGSISANGQRLQ